MRKGFNGLEALVADRLKECPQSGALYSVQQQETQSAQSALLRWHRLVGALQASGTRAVQLAQARRERSR